MLDSSSLDVEYVLLVIVSTVPSRGCVLRGHHVHGAALLLWRRAHACTLDTHIVVLHAEQQNIVSGVIQDTRYPECWIPHPRDGGSVLLRICRMYHHPQHLHQGCTVLHWCCTIHWCIRGTTVHAVAYQRYQQHASTHECRP